MAGLVAVATVEDEGPGAVSSDTMTTLPAGVLADRVRFVLRYVNEGGTDEEVAAQFTTSFLAAVPVAQFRQITETQVRPGGPYVIEEVTSNPTPWSATLRLRGATGVASTMTISLELAAGHLISGLRFQPAPDAPLRVADYPRGPIGDQLRWVLATVNGGDPVTRDVATHLALSVAGEAEKVRAALVGLRGSAPFALERYAAPIASTDLRVVIRGADNLRYLLTVAIEPAAPHRLTVLFFGNASAANPPKSWAELDDRMEDAAPDVAFLAAEVVGTGRASASEPDSDGLGRSLSKEPECRAIHAVGADRVQPLGSIFKLYVLGALALEVDAARARWDEPITIRNDLRTQGSAKYGTVATGTTATVRDLAMAMISVSDNTATDHLMGRVGRARVEAAQGVLGTKDPGRNLPFLTSGELTRLKWVLPETEREKYLSFDAEGRAAFLAALPPAPSTEAELRAIPASPTAIDRLEWFASPADVCRAHVVLQGMTAKRPGPLFEILSTNPGAPIDQKVWSATAYKGGSEPGVLALSWLLTHRDARRFVVVALFQNRGGRVDDGVITDVTGAFALLAEAGP